MVVEFRKVARSWRFWLGASMLLGLGFWLGHTSTVAPVSAQQQVRQTQTPAQTDSQSTRDDTLAKAKRVVAYIYGDIPVTREEFGEYLIDLYVKDRIELFVNKKIIELECAKHRIDVTDAEIDAAIEDDCKKINIKKADFIVTVLKRYN